MDVCLGIRLAIKRTLLTPQLTFQEVVKKCCETLWRLPQALSIILTRIVIPLAVVWFHQVHPSHFQLTGVLVWFSGSIEIKPSFIVTLISSWENWNTHGSYICIWNFVHGEVQSRRLRDKETPNPMKFIVKSLVASTSSHLSKRYLQDGVYLKYMHLIFRAWRGPVRTSWILKR